MSDAESRAWVRIVLEGLLLDLEHVARDCAASGNKMGLYLLDLALEECRMALSNLEVGEDAW